MRAGCIKMSTWTGKVHRTDSDNELNFYLLNGERCLFFLQHSGNTNEANMIKKSS
jgi:hypothetical protein